MGKFTSAALSYFTPLPALPQDAADYHSMCSTFECVEQSVTQQQIQGKRNFCIAVPLQHTQSCIISAGIKKRENIVQALASQQG